MSLAVEIRHTAGAFSLDVKLQLGAGLTALLGPSGSGKTTVLNVIAGIVRPDKGRVQIDDDVVVDTAAGIFRPAYRRSIGYVFQEPRLFPHLTVRQNLMFARWFRHHGPASRSPEEVIDLLNLGALLGRYPSKLSGGEKQRVALGRALLSMPRLLLLDEPLAAVDQSHREVILPYLDRLRADLAIPTVYVTHTWAEVTGRADHVIELDGGKVRKGAAEDGQSTTG